ncbi:MAG: SpoIIE family protein phosphatase [Planctomycetes bacterium]|nr:SpoIIE family protein phosphatase [Planctomycetota bacterium]
MGRRKAEPELKLSGPRLASRFAITMSAALGVVMLAAGAFLYSRMISAASAIQESAFVDATRNQGPLLEQLAEDQARALRGLGPDGSKPRLEAARAVPNTPIREYAGGDVRRTEVRYGPAFEQEGFLYQWKAAVPPLVVPASTKEKAGEGLFGLILGVTLFVILVGALVAYLVGNAVARPLEIIVDDIAQISRGDLRHRTRVRSGGEVMLLAKSIDRMAGNLESAQEAERELSKRERELALAGEVREALMPDAPPAVPGCDLGALHVDSAAPGGDFYEFLPFEDGKVGLLVCEVSGRGIPGALIGAIARSYLRVELSRGADVAAALQRVNRELARDVRRGMYVTALYALIDPAGGRATVACAGHKLPLVRYAAAEKAIRLVQPEGIALGFDKGPVFDRTLQVVQVAFEPGDRLLLSNTGPVRVVDAAGAEIGEKAFYKLVLKHAGQTTEALFGRLEADLRAHAGDTPFPGDISIVSIVRRA